ncbi:MAG: virulence RhuM family protein [Bacteroidaceae bacterium]|nr:virulence RhuM family protein [Bacteroidaceae bacterium]
MEREATGEIILYQPDETLSLQVKLDTAHDTVWLNRQQMAELFGRDVKTIGKHVNNALKEELASESVIAKFATTASDGKIYQVDYYNLDVVLSVGYRVKSNRGIQFRRWANHVLKEYLQNGYSVNHHLIALQQQMDSRFETLESRVDKQQEQLDFLVKTHSTPEEQLFPNGCVWDAYSYVSALIRSAKEQVILIDNFC